jgi:nitrite reductase/ring-hydroxylating ferredoxin subunit
MTDFIEAARLDEIETGCGICVAVGGKDIALFNVDGKIYATDDGCLHQGLSLGSSKLEGKVVTCRAHGWRYDVTTGNTLHVADYGVNTYPVEVVDGKVLVDIDIVPREN